MGRFYCANTPCEITAESAMTRCHEYTMVPDFDGPMKPLDYEEVYTLDDFLGFTQKYGT